MKNRHTASTVRPQPLVNQPDPGGNGDMQSPAPRLMDMHQAARYCSVSYWTVRDWVNDGVLPIVRLPGARLRYRGKMLAPASPYRPMRKILVDLADINKLINASKT